MRRLLPWDYGVRNLFRRPSRSALTLGGLSIVILLVLVVVGFIRGLEASLAATGQPNVVLVYAMTSGSDIENSAIPGRTPALLAASVAGVRSQFGEKFIAFGFGAFEFVADRGQRADDFHGAAIGRRGGKVGSRCFGAVIVLRLAYHMDSVRRASLFHNAYPLGYMYS